MRAGTLASIAALMALFQTVRAEEAQPEPPEVMLPLSEIAVAPGRAIVSRSSEIALPQGAGRVRINGLPPAMDRDSLQADLPDAAQAQIETVKLELVAARKLEPERIQAVEKELAELDRQIKGLEDQHQLLGAELLVIQTFSPELKPFQNANKFAADMLPHVTVLDPATWLSVIRFSGNLAEKKRQVIAEVVAKKKDLELKRQEAAAKLEELRKTAVPARVVADISFHAEKAGNVKLTVRYAVDHVAWYPVYELHADEEGRKVEIERHALVAQNTGEDWTGTRLVFLTLPPEKAVTVPEINAWHIAYTDVYGSVESRNFGQQRPEEEAIARLTAIPGPEALLALREACRSGNLLDLTKAFDYEDRLVQESLELGKASLGEGYGGILSFGQRNGGERTIMVKRHGGSRATESGVDRGLHWLAQAQRADGSWNDTNDERNTVGITGITLLAFLGAGHTPKVGEYKENVKNGLNWLAAHVRSNGQIGNSLFDQCQATTALAEGYGMSGQQEWVDPTLRCIRYLDHLLRNRILPLTPGLTGNRFPDGVENLAFATMAAKSAKVAGLPVPHSLFDSLLILAQQLENTKATPHASAVIAMSRLFMGYQPHDVEKHVQQMMTELPAWTPGRFHLGFFQIATLVAFQCGGETWKQWNDALKAMLVAKQTNEGWPAEDAWIGPTNSRVATSAFCATCLEVYYRYLQLDSSGGAGALAATTAKAAWAPVSPQVSANGRVYRFHADGLRSVIGDGEFHRIPIDRKTVVAQTLHVATPVIYKGVFLQSALTNPFDEPLLEGAARVFLGNEFMGETPLAQVESGKEAVVPLGEDPYVAISRKVTEETTLAGKLTKLFTLRAGIQISVENKRKIPVKVHVFDRLAISGDTRVRVRNGELKGGLKRTQQDDGVALWELELKAGEKSLLEAAYEVEYPEGVVPRPVVEQ